MKQTAVEWLIDNLKSHFEHDGDLLEVVQFSFNQAKAMEKEQIIEAHAVGRIKEVSQINTDGYEYYKETYEK